MNLVRSSPESISVYSAYKKSLILTEEGREFLPKMKGVLTGLASVPALTLDEKLCEAAEALLKKYFEYYEDKESTGALKERKK